MDRVKPVVDELLAHHRLKDAERILALIAQLMKKTGNSIEGKLDWQGTSHSIALFNRRLPA
jgi:hypothetical protein